MYNKVVPSVLQPVVTPLDDLFLREVYEHLHRLARSFSRKERTNHTLQPSALINEAYLRMAQRDGIACNNRGPFLRLAARTMRQVLIDHSRPHNARKRDHAQGTEPWTESQPGLNLEQYLTIDSALQKLEEIDPRQAEIVEIRFLGGLSIEETAAAMGLPEKTVKRDWTFARAWLREELEAVALPPDELLGLVYAAELDPVVIKETARLLALEAKPDSPFDRLAAPMQMMAQSAADQRMLRAGQLLAGRYRIVRMVGTGGMGEVCEAEDIEEGAQIAVKTARALYATASHAAWLRREVEAARRVKHPDVCRVYGFVQNEEVSFLTMEFLAGETLAVLLEREGPFPERLRVGGTPGVVITDFGLARQARAEVRNTASAALSTVASFGTPAYMAPEQIAGQSVNAMADQYAFGVLAHEMLTGELPFADESALAIAVRKTSQQAKAPESLAPGARKNWSRTILRCLDPNPKSQFASVG